MAETDGGYYGWSSGNSEEEIQGTKSNGETGVSQKKPSGWRAAARRGARPGGLVVVTSASWRPSLVGYGQQRGAPATSGGRRHPLPRGGGGGASFPRRRGPDGPCPAHPVGCSPHSGPGPRDPTMLTPGWTAGQGWTREGGRGVGASGGRARRGQRGARGQRVSVAGLRRRPRRRGRGDGRAAAAARWRGPPAQARA